MRKTIFYFSWFSCVMRVILRDAHICGIRVHVTWPACEIGLVV